MRDALRRLLAHALDRLAAEGVLAPDAAPPPLERTRDPAHGAFTSNVALLRAKSAGVPPRELAARVVAALPQSPLVARVEVAGPGFINFHLTEHALHAAVLDILAAGDAYGRCDIGQGEQVLIEFVSANPTGPLHVGHGRGAAYGSALADLLSLAGYRVEREYYVNDAGRQMDILALSVWLRYLEAGGSAPAFPSAGYRGDYVRELAATLRAAHDTALERGLDAGGLPADAPEGDADVHLDALIARAREALGAEAWRMVHAHGTDAILADIEDDLAAFGVRYERWLRESAVVADGAVDAALARLDAAGHLYVQDGATWFRASAFGDRQDRVVVRENGEHTYFANDIAYHLHKFERGYTRVINIWGADHHGYIPRVRAALRALELPVDRLEVLLVQFAVLYRGAEKVSMSTRSGEFVTLRELRGEVGTDAARLFYLLRKTDQHLDFDLELARSQSNDNPVYYVQYAHTRVCAVLREARARGIGFDPAAAPDAIARLGEQAENTLIGELTRYPEVIEAAARAHEPHQVAYYLRELAAQFHGYYNSHPFLVEDEALRSARLALVSATGQVLRNGLSLLGVSAPEQM